MASVTGIRMIFFSLAIAKAHAGTMRDGFMLLALPVNAAPSNPTAPCLLRAQVPIRRDDYTYVPDFSGYKLHTRAATWAEARLICQEEGGHLAIVNSIAESHAVAKVFTDAEPIVGSELPTNAFIGFHDLYREGEYVTIHEESLQKAGYEQWETSQPNNHQIQNCGAIKKNGRLNDLWCDRRFGFICEIPASQSNGDIGTAHFFGTLPNTATVGTNGTPVPSVTPPSLNQSKVVRSDYTGSVDPRILLVYESTVNPGVRSVTVVEKFLMQVLRTIARSVPGFNSYRLHTRAVIWASARLICQEEGGHLAIINSNGEADAISQVFNKAERITGSEFPDRAFLGYHDLYREGKYVTIHGESLQKAGYARWDSGQPNNLNIQNCGGVTKDGLLDDLWCNDPFGFICEKPEGRDDANLGGVNVA